MTDTQPSDGADPTETITAQQTGAATASGGGIANTGVMRDVIIHSPARSPVVWPVQVGLLPGLASAFQPRPGLRDEVLAARRHGADVVLTQDDTRPTVGTRVLAGGGGVGKSQLAAWFAGQALTTHTTDLVVWVNAGSLEQVITGYARAALRAGAPGADGTDPAADAAALLEWLHTTDRRWLIVLDDIVDAADVAGWWPPHRPRGWTLATTRLRDTVLHSGGRERIDVGVYRPDESTAYLTDRLTTADHSDLLDVRVAELAAVLGHLPLALAHAAAYMIDQEMRCEDYLARYTTSDQTLTELMPDVGLDGYDRPVAVTLLLAVDAADRANPAGLARPALALAALLDPDGHPEALWATNAVTSYLSTHSPVSAVTADQAWQALRLLHRYGLLTHTPRNPARAVSIHALTARAARENITTTGPVVGLVDVVRAAADALLSLWPADDHRTTDLVDALRANTTTLAGHAGDLLWNPDQRPLLYRAGGSLLRAGLYTPAIGYWNHAADQATRFLGDQHPDTLAARGNLAVSYWQAGRIDDAITLGEKVVADRVRVLGDQHPDTLTSRANLAASYEQAGRIDDAITLGEKVVADTVRVLGDQHPDTLTSRGNLASAYRRAGRTAEAIALLEKVVADRVRVLGDQHPDTLTSRVNLAASYEQAGRTADAVTVGETVVADRVRVLGDQHPDTLTARANLASCYLQAGRTAEAISLGEKVVADRVRVLGDEHPDTLTARGNLAAYYRWAGRTGNAITIEEKVVADRMRVLGDQHPDTLTARANLAASYRQAGRTGDAITIEEKVVADRVRLLGDQHPSTLTARGNLAHSYLQAGRTGDAITVGEKVVADAARILGDQHPDTLTARANLAASYLQAGRTGDAITVGEKVVADAARILGEEHPYTLTARANLAASYLQAGRTGDAITLLEKAVADSVRVLGEQHPETRAAVDALRAWRG